MVDRPTFEIRPLEFSWMEWRNIYKVQHVELTRMVKECGPATAAYTAGRHKQETANWLKRMSVSKQQDVIELLIAEQGLLFDLIDPPGEKKPARGSYAFTEFRERYFQAVPLLRATVDAEVKRSKSVARAYAQLEDYATAQEWLP
jgi:hypothetical protein